MSEYDVERRGILVSSLIPESAPDRTLEVGCGTGAITEKYRDCVGDLLLTDISERLALEAAHRNNARGQAENALSLSFPDNSFDLVISSECVEHTPDPARAVMEMIRVLKPGGHLVLTTPNRLWLPVVLAAKYFKIRRFQGEECFLSIRKMRLAVSAGGGRLLCHTGCHLFPWQIPGMKPLLRVFDRYGDRLFRIMINQAVLVEKIDKAN